MRSRASINSHPLHPILIVFPIAFFTGTVVFDVLGLIRVNEGFEITARYLLIAGTGAAVVAAIPGLVDFLHTVPPHSSAKKRAGTHALLNLCMLALFAAALVYRETSDWPSAAIFLFLEFAGLVLMLIAGWMGATLVHRNQIGIDPRYAFAGKWKEMHPTEKNGKVDLGKGDLKRDQMKLIHLSGRRIVLARTGESYVAFDDHCAHRGGSLAGGVMICGTVQCPWHGSQFDVQTGEVKAGPASKKIRTYKVETDGDNLRLNIYP